MTRSLQSCLSFLFWDGKTLRIGPPSPVSFSFTHFRCHVGAAIHDTSPPFVLCPTSPASRVPFPPSVHSGALGSRAVSTSLLTPCRPLSRAVAPSRLRVLFTSPSGSLRPSRRPSGGLPDARMGASVFRETSQTRLFPCYTPTPAVTLRFSGRPPTRPLSAHRGSLAARRGPRPDKTRASGTLGASPTTTSSSLSLFGSGRLFWSGTGRGVA